MDQPPHNTNHAATRHDPPPPPRGPDPDAHLLARHHDGDPEALGQLLQSHADRLYRLCLRMARNHATAEELAQDAMVRIIAGLPQFDGRAWFKSWITRITVNVCISHLRRITGGRTVADGKPERLGSYFGRGGDDFAPPTKDSREPDPAASVQSSEEIADLLEALANLEPEPRALLILRDQHGHDYEFLAEVFGVPAGTIKSRLFRARSNLRKEIEKIHDHRRVPRTTTEPSPETDAHNDQPGNQRNRSHRGGKEA